MKLCGIDGCCDHLENRLVDGGKGFKALYTLKMGDPSPLTRFLGVVYKTGAKDRGLLLNVCPWCGGKPGYYERDETANAIAQGREHSDAATLRKVIQALEIHCKRNGI